MFDISLGEIVVIFIVTLLVVGPKKLPEAARALGRGYAEFRRLMSDIRGTIDRDETVSKLRDEFQSFMGGWQKFYKVLPEYKVMGEDGHEYGPVSAEQIRQWVAERRLERKSPIWKRS